MIVRILKDLNMKVEVLIEKPIRNLVIFSTLFRVIIFSIFYSTVSIFPDSEGYIELSNLISDFNLEGYHGLRSPGYPLIIAILNQNLYLVVIFQFIIGIFSNIIWYKTLINYGFNKKNSFIITIFLLSFINVFFFETCILVESFILFMISILFYLLSCRILDKLNAVSIFLLSLFFVFLVLIKPFYAFLPFLILFFLFVKRPHFKTIFSKNIFLIIFPLIAYYGWCYVNKLNTGYFAATSYYGITNAQNCVYFAEKVPKEYEWISKPYVEYREKSIKENKVIAMTIWYAYEDGAFDKYNLSFQELSKELENYTKVAIKNNPFDYLKQIMLRSWFDFWKPTIYWNYDKFNFSLVNKVFAGIWYIQYAILFLLKLIFLGLIPYYFYQFYKKRQLTNELTIVIIVFSNSILQAIVTYGTNYRFSFPYEFIMIISVLLFLKSKLKIPTT